MNWQPAWTTAVRIESGGRYPLGLNRFHNGLEEILIKSITMQANRLRYYTYCCWAIGDIERSEACQNRAEFVQAFQQRETALAIGLCLSAPDYSVPGSDRISRMVTADADTYPCDFSIMQSNDLGAFGLYYIGTSYALGLVENTEEGMMKLTPAGRMLYEIAEKRYRRHKPTYYVRYRGQSPVPTAVLREWGETNDFANMRSPDCQTEREFFQSLLFRLNQNNPGDCRRDTLAFFLACIAHCEESCVPFTEEVLSHIHTYRCYQRESGEVVPFAVPEQFQDVHFHWAIYEGHVYFRGWLSQVFQVFLNYLRGSANGASLEAFINEIDADSFNETITRFLGVRTDWLRESMGNILDQIGGPPDLTNPFSEAQVTADERYESLSGIMAKFVLVMAALWQRFREVRDDRRYQCVALNLSSDLWFNVLFQLPTLQQMPAVRFLQKMVQAYVLNQHDRIMIEKNDLRRCWFTTEQGKYFFQADVNVIWRPAKFNTIMNFLCDMNLIELQDDQRLRLTTEGRTLSQRLKAGE